MRLFLVTAALLATAACTVGPNYKTPSVEPPADWAARDQTEAKALTAAEAEALSAWWSQFNDPLLDELIAQARAHNPTLAAAQAGVREARAAARATLSGRLPSANAGGGFERARTSETSQFGRIPGFELTNNNFQVGFDAAWELDLWGKERRRIESARAGLEATTFAAEDVALSLYAEVVRSYVILRGTDHRLAILQSNIALQKQTAATITRLVDSGLLDLSAKARTEADLAQTRALEPGLKANREAAAFALGVLVGRDPEALLDQLNTGAARPITPDLMHPGLRADLLRRRPDIRAAERRLAAQTADIGVAAAELLPSVALTTSVGFNSTATNSFLDAASRTWAVAPRITLPIFNRDRLKAMVAIEEAQAEGSLAEYRQSVLNALLEVETALTRYDQALQTRDHLLEADRAVQQAVRLTQRRFDAGEDDVLDLLDVQRQQLSVQDQRADAELQIQLNLVSIYKAMGGGWNAP